MTGAAGPPRQLVLDLPVEAATGAGDFLIGASNAAAAELVESWPHWTQPSAIIVGPAACGKSHLVEVFRARAGAPVVAARDLSDATIALFQQADIRALAVEDIDRGLSDERVLFHLLNHARETGRQCLLTSRAAPGDLAITLPDLRSRLRALAMIPIADPDDALLGALLVKLFADRQLNVEPAIVAHMIRHMGRSFEAARTLVARIDALALAERRKVTRTLVNRAMAEMGGEVDKDGLPEDG